MPYVFDEETGEYVWEDDPDEGPTAAPQVAGPSFVPRYKGEVYVDPATGTKFVADYGRSKKTSYDPKTGALDLSEGGLEWTIPGAKESGSGSGIAVAGINAESSRLGRESQERVAALDREAKEKIAALQDANEDLDREERIRKNDLDEAYRRDDLAERARATKALEEIQAHRLELDKAIQQWTEYYQGEGLKLQEHQGRVSEAGVTGFYRPSSTTAFPRVGQQVASPGLGITATLDRDKFQASQATAPSLQATAPPVTSQAPGAVPQATQAPATDTSMLNSRELAEYYKTQQTGPPPQGEATQAPQSQPNEQPVMAQTQRLKREIKEYY